MPQDSTLDEDTASRAVLDIRFDHDVYLQDGMLHMRPAIKRVVMRYFGRVLIGDPLDHNPACSFTQEPPSESHPEGSVRLEFWGREHPSGPLPTGPLERIVFRLPKPPHGLLVNDPDAWKGPELLEHEVIPV